MAGWDRRSWVSLSPYGLGHQKPNPLGDILRAAWENRGRLGYAWRILSRGACDGCSLGTCGLRDWTMAGPHLCNVRLGLLRLNTMPALDPARLADVAALRTLPRGELRRLGRLPCPLVRRKGDSGFRPVGWDEALNLVASRIRQTEPARMAFFTTSRGITNETYYAVQKTARFLGTNNVDNSARVCHAPSATAMRQVLGVDGATCSFKDWIGTDLLVFVGSDVANNQPVATKYIYLARRAGTRVAVINPFREPGMERYWVPTAMESALFGTRLTDEFFAIHTGGDLAFLNGVLKALLASGDVDRGFIADHTAGFDELAATLDLQSWGRLERDAGASRADMERFAHMYARARTAVFVWSQGVTQHRRGDDNVRAIVNLALARGMVGREKCGLMPLRGHSGVQGASELGCAPDMLPGGICLVKGEPTDSVGAAATRRLSRLWGFPVPEQPGLAAIDMLAAAGQGELDVLYSLGGNFVETGADPVAAAAALSRIALRVHQDIVVTSAMLVDPAEAVVLLPAQTRYETAGGTTQTSGERRIIFSPEISGPRVPAARPDWQIPIQVAQRAFPERASQLDFDGPEAIRQEIARVVPPYAGIETLRRPGDAVQWGGPRLCTGGECPTGDGRARFSALEPSHRQIPAGFFILTTRRGRQFTSMVQSERDPLTGAERDAVFMCEADAAGLELKTGDRVLVESEAGQYFGRCYLAPLRPRNVQVFWPEGNVLLGCDRLDPQSGAPEHQVLVRVVPLDRPQMVKLKSAAELASASGLAHHIPGISR